MVVHLGVHVMGTDGGEGHEPGSREANPIAEGLGGRPPAKLKARHQLDNGRL